MAALPKFLVRLLTGPGGYQEITPAQAGGVSFAGQIPALDATTGLLATSMMPIGVGPDVDNTGVCSATALTAGMYVNIFNAAGIKTIRPADSTDNTKPAHGFVLTGYTVGQTVTVYLTGAVNNLIPVGSFVAADVGKPIYLATSGAITTTPPATTGNLSQILGVIDNVGATVLSCFSPYAPITLA